MQLVQPDQFAPHHTQLTSLIITIFNYHSDSEKRLVTLICTVIGIKANYRRLNQLSICNLADRAPECVPKSRLSVRRSFELLQENLPQNDVTSSFR